MSVLNSDQHIAEADNGILNIRIKQFGAELCSIVNKQSGTEYLWQAGNEWPKHAPVLFPIVGQLKENTYWYNGKAYTLNRHGFARDSKFKVTENDKHSVSLLFESDETTLVNYPFIFSFIQRYQLKNNSIIVESIIENKGETEMLYSTGAHPAFRVPIDKDLSYDNYFLESDWRDEITIWPLQDGLISNTSSVLRLEKNRLPLSYRLFHNDALVFKNESLSYMIIKSDKDHRSVRLDFPDSPYLGIWAAKNADFVCIEPWQGIADSVGSNQRLNDKEGIIRLSPGEIKKFQYIITINE